MDFKYINEPEDRYELAVLDANYKWIRTNEVMKTRSGGFDIKKGIDRLLRHSHSGINTHLIRKGDLEFRMDSARGRPVTHVIDSDPSGSKHELKVYRGRRYEATSKRGAKFVEGHRSLSPATAERFMDRGTLLAVPKGKLDWEDYEQSLAGVESPNIGTYEDFADYLRQFGKEKPWPSHSKWPRQTTIRKWLREATFNPEDERKRFVLRWRDAVHEEADIEARKRLENWFHKEWRPTREEIRDINTDGLYDDSDTESRISINTKLGIPTANLPVDASQTPWISDVTSGVYFGYASLALPSTHPDYVQSSSAYQIYPMVMSIGFNPYYKNTVRSAEVHVLHKFSSDFYDVPMRLLILGFIREEKDYNGLEALIEDINIDCDVARQSLNRDAWTPKEGVVGSGKGTLDGTWLVMA
ncbi:riboflavin kinase [Seiridium cupressi]